MAEEPATALRQPVFLSPAVTCCHLPEEIPKHKAVLPQFVTPSAHTYTMIWCTRLRSCCCCSVPTSCLFMLLAGQGMRANKYPPDPAGALEAWARTRWPAAGQRVYQWSYQVSRSVQVCLFTSQVVLSSNCWWQGDGTCTCRPQPAAQPLSACVT